MKPGQVYNPFSSHLVKPARGGYIFTEDATFQDLQQVLDTLRTNSYRGHLVGPHGAGKSTLLYDIQNSLTSAGLSVVRWQASDRRRGLPRGWMNDILASNCILIDGAERLYPGLLSLVRLITRQNGTGLIVTTHSPLSLGAAIPVTPNPHALAMKVTALTVGNPTTTLPDSHLVNQLASHLQQHHGNAREVLFDLYIHYEHQEAVYEKSPTSSSD